MCQLLLRFRLRNSLMPGQQKEERVGGSVRE